MQSENLSDQAALVTLLGRVAMQDRAAFADLYSRTSAKLFGTCLRILSDSSSAEDALQESYVSIWNQAQRFDAAKASAMTWLISIARNRAIDRLRRMRAGAQGQAVPVEAAIDMADGSLGADDALAQQDDVAALNRCLSGLDPADAGFIQASFLRGATYAELAARDATPLGTIKSRIRRALIKLRTCLEQSGVEAAHG
jgi:RNA polymerase sigma factor (sigma-70 family)